LNGVEMGREPWVFRPNLGLFWGDYVWSDTNGDGIQNGSETGWPGVTVNLLSSTNSIVAQTVTDGSGYYAFRDMTPASYRIQVIAPPGTIFSPPDQGSDGTLDSDVDSSGMTPLFTVSAGEVRTDLDAGLTASGGSGGSAWVGDRVWNDTDRDGIQDDDEAGIGGVTVRLLDATANVLATASTDANGYYAFSGLGAGTYRVEFGVPPGMQFSPRDQGGGRLRG
jgi:serine-aspartate repeat-containing protein C/D/E